MRIINFAHGDLMMIGMYLAWYAFARLGIDPYVSLLGTVPVMFLLGVVLQSTLVNRVLDDLPQNQILLTIGIGLVMRNAMMLCFTSDYRILTTAYSSSSIKLSAISLSRPLLLSFFLTAVLIASLVTFLARTDVGLAIRATAQDRDAARLMGIDVKRIAALAFGIGSALAGAAGAMIAPTYYIFPDVGEGFTLKAFVIVVLGGMGSTAGAMLGGIIVGITESLSAVYLSSGLKELMVFVLFLCILLVKPSGLLGKVRA
jgi:branched-chain amino acid transport system permease protein